MKFSPPKARRRFNVFATVEENDKGQLVTGSKPRQA